MKRAIFFGLVVIFSFTDGLAAAQPRVSLQSNPEGGFKLYKDEHLVGNIGQSLFSSSLSFDDIETVKFTANDDVRFKLKVKFDETRSALNVRVEWETTRDQSLSDCFDFGNKQWYGGPEQKSQYWPIQNGNFEKYSYVTKEDDNAAVIERYWLNSDGEFIYVDLDVPLFIDQNNLFNNSLCLVAAVEAPYSKKRTYNKLSYDLWFLKDAKTAHKYAVEKYLGKPKGLPDYRMIEHPIWSTWARYEREIDDESLSEYANEILSYGFKNSQFEIDDLWEICYGSLTINEAKFPDFKKTVKDLKALGFRVTIWIHPFINEGCDPWYSEALENGYLILNEEGSPHTVWWNSNGTNASHVDFTNPDAAAWWSGRVSSLLKEYDIDSAKFDAGESSWTPQIPVQSGDINFHPAHITRDYVETVAKFGVQIEVRSGLKTQHLPIFVRMVDKDTYWGFNNGLATLVTTLLQMNLNGYTLVLPDMIGGNGYNAFPGKELFIRWLQANVFMPALQYSFAPWDYDTEAVEISLKYTNLHAQYASAIKKAMENSIRYGTPVNPPIWWLDPTDATALQTWDEFLLGEAILAAPVLTEGATSRDIYLPKGVWWAEGNSSKVYVGPQWLLNYAAPLDVLPYFVRKI